MSTGGGEGQKIFRNALLLFYISQKLMEDLKSQTFFKNIRIFQNTGILKNPVGAMPNIIFCGHSLRALRLQRSPIFRKFQK